jgi:hypothetical protein
MKKYEAHNLICEALIETLNAENIGPGGSEEAEFQRGVKAGLKSRVQGGKFIILPDQLKQQSKAFIKGYKKSLGEDWWTKFNDKLTQFAGQLGYSRTRGF